MSVYKRKQREQPVGKIAPNKTKAQEIWETRIADAEAHKDVWAVEFGCEAIENAYYGFQKPDWWTDKGWFTINKLMSSVRVLKRTVCPRRLQIKMSLSRTYKADPQMVQLYTSQISLRRSVMQYMFNRLRVVDEARRAYVQSKWAFGCLKVGYSARLEANDMAGEVKLDSMGNIIIGDDGTPIIEQDNKVADEQFFVDAVDWECFLVDRYAGNDLNKSGRWCAHKIFRPIEEVKKDPLYRNTKTLEPSVLNEREQVYLKQEEEYKRPPQFRVSGRTFLPEDELVVLYEVYDLERNEILTLARDHNKVLRGPEPMPNGIIGHPFVFYKPSETRLGWYPVPGMHSWMGPQLEYNVRRNMLGIHIKRLGSKYIYDENKIEPDEVAKLEQGRDGIYAKGQPGAIESLMDPPMGSEFLWDTMQLRSEFDEESGVTEQRRGKAGSDSATEAQILDTNSKEMESDEHESMMVMLEEVANKLHACIEANLTQEGAVSILGPTGQQWYYFGPEDFETIEGEYVFEIVPEAIGRQTMQVERAQTLQFLDIIMKWPFIPMAPNLMKKLSDTFPSIADDEQVLMELRQIGTFMVAQQAGAIGMPPQGRDPRSPKPAPTSQGQVASKSRPTHSNRR